MNDTPPEHSQPRPLSQHDPLPDPDARRRPPLLLIIGVVLLVTSMVVLHLTGVVGAGSH